MIASIYFMLALWPSVFAGKQASFECSLHRPQQAATVNSKGELHSDVLQKIGGSKAIIGAPQSTGGEIIFASGQSNRFTWLFGARRYGYSFEMTDYPASEVAHFLLTEHGVSGGRHGFDQLAGFGTCKVTLGDGRSMKQ